jgi:hypothetical protein
MKKICAIDYPSIAEKNQLLKVSTQQKQYSLSGDKKTINN